MQLVKGSLAAPVIALQFLKMAAVIKVCACNKLQSSVLIFLSKLWSFTLANYLHECLYFVLFYFTNTHLAQVYIHRNIKNVLYEPFSTLFQEGTIQSRSGICSTGGTM